MPCMCRLYGEESACRGLEVMWYVLQTRELKVETLKQAGVEKSLHGDRKGRVLRVRETGACPERFGASYKFKRQQH